MLIDYFKATVTLHYLKVHEEKEGQSSFHCRFLLMITAIPSFGGGKWLQTAQT